MGDHAIPSMRISPYSLLLVELVWRMIKTRIDFDRLLKLRLIVARVGEMDLAKWWNTRGHSVDLELRRSAEDFHVPTIFAGTLRIRGRSFSLS